MYFQMLYIISTQILTFFLEILNHSTVGQITIFLDINRIRHKMVKNAIKVEKLRRKTSLGPNFFA